MKEHIIDFCIKNTESIITILTVLGLIFISLILAYLIIEYIKDTPENIKKEREREQMKEEAKKNAKNS